VTMIVVITGTKTGMSVVSITLL